MTAPTGWDVTGYYAAQLLPEQAPPDSVVRVAELGIITPRPLQLGDFLGGAFRAVRYSPVTMFGVTLMGMLVAQLLAVGVGVVAGREFTSVLDTTELGAVGSLAGWTTIVSYLTTSVATIILQIGLAFAVHEAVFARRTPPSAALRRIGSGAGAALGFAGLVLLAYLAVGLIVALLANISTTSQNAIGWVILVPLILAAAVLSMFLSIRLLLVPPVIAIEKLGPIAAIRRSWELTTGQFWRFLGIFLLSNILISMAANVISTVFSFVAILVSASNPEFGLMVAVAATTVATAVFYIPLSTSVITLLYTDARIRREGHDLAIAEALYG